MDVDEGQAEVAERSWRFFALWSLVGLLSAFVWASRDFHRNLLFMGLGAASGAVATVAFLLLTRTRAPRATEVTLTGVIGLGAALVALSSKRPEFLTLWLAIGAFVTATLALLLRAQWGWRIARDTEVVTLAPRPAAQFSLRFMMAACAIVALAAVLTQAFNGFRANLWEFRMWSGYLLIFGSLAAGVCLMASVVLVPGRTRRPALKLLLAAIPLALIEVILRYAGGANENITLLVFTGYVTQLSLLTLLKWFGYRLIIPGRSRLGPAEGIDSGV